MTIGSSKIEQVSFAVFTGGHYLSFYCSHIFAQNNYVAFDCFTFCLNAGVWRRAQG